MTKRVMRIPNPNPPLQVPGGLAYSDPEKAEALANNLESQFHPLPVPPMLMDHVQRVRYVVKLHMHGLFSVIVGSITAQVPMEGCFY
jgi:hypothetical protein